jgi:hypothetical protein
VSAAPEASDFTTTETADVGQAPERRLSSSLAATALFAASLESAGRADAERLHGSMGYQHRRF